MTGLYVYGKRADSPDIFLIISYILITGFNLIIKQMLQLTTNMLGFLLLLSGILLGALIAWVINKKTGEQ